MLINKQINMNNNAYDFVVVGGGVFGLSTSLFLATHYPKVKFTLVEQFKIGHGEGSSHSEIRIIRSTYPKAFYRDLCIEGINKYWPQVQKLLKQTFITPNSCLFYDEHLETSKMYEQVARTSKGQIEILSIKEVRERFPTAPFVETNLPVFHDKKAGVVFAQRYIQAMTKFLRNYANITIFEETTVTSITNSEQGVKITARNKDGQIELLSKKVSLSCGRWIGKLIPSMNRIVQEARQTVSFWQMKQPQNYIIGKFPCWVHKLTDGTQYYGLPDVNGIGLKYGLHSQDSTLFNRFKTQAQYEKYIIENYRKHSEQYFKGRYAKLNKIQKCYYTVTKTEDFLVDWSDQYENILIVSPCSGHGFKFGPVIGKIVSDLLVQDSSIPVFQESRYICRLFYHLGVNLT